MRIISKSFRLVLSPLLRASDLAGWGSVVGMLLAIIGLGAVVGFVRANAADAFAGFEASLIAALAAFLLLSFYAVMKSVARIAEIEESVYLAMVATLDFRPLALHVERDTSISGSIQVGVKLDTPSAMPLAYRILDIAVFCNVGNMPNTSLQSTGGTVTSLGNHTYWAPEILVRPGGKLPVEVILEVTLAYWNGRIREAQTGVMMRYKFKADLSASQVAGLAVPSQSPVARQMMPRWVFLKEENSLIDNLAAFMRDHRDTLVAREVRE